MKMNLTKEPTSRVEILGDGAVKVIEINMNGHEKRFKNTESLPKWMQEKLHILNILDHTPSRKSGNSMRIKGVGRRINKNTFWVEHTD